VESWVEGDASVNHARMLVTANPRLPKSDDKQMQFWTAAKGQPGSDRYPGSMRSMPGWKRASDTRHKA
jgi:hypothetical protein